MKNKDWKYVGTFEDNFGGEFFAIGDTPESVIETLETAAGLSEGEILPHNVSWFKACPLEIKPPPKQIVFLDDFSPDDHF